MMMLMVLMVVMMVRYLGKGGKGGVKTIRGFWLNHSVVETRVDWVPGVSLIINDDDSDYDEEEDGPGDENGCDNTGVNGEDDAWTCQ